MLGASPHRGLRDEVGPGDTAVAETSKGEPMAKIEKFDLEPADGFEIAGCDSNGGALVTQMPKNLVDTRHFVDLHFGPARGYVIAHLLEDAFKMRPPVFFIEFGELERVAQDTWIGVAAKGYAFKGKLATHDAAHARKEGIDVNAIAASQQSAVDVKEVCVLRVPAEALTLKDAGWLSFSRCHSVVLPFYSG